MSDCKRVTCGWCDTGYTVDTVADIIDALTGGYETTVYDAPSWKARGEKFAKTAYAIVVHDGGAAAPAFNWDYCQYDLVERMNAALREHGLYAEQQTSWYTGIYPIK